jgi:hypothetical protein
MNLEDIYVAIEASRRGEAMSKFTGNYLKGFRPESDYFEYPPFFGDTEFETDDYREMLDYVLSENGRSFQFYFVNAENQESPRAMIFINKDGSVFFGLGVESRFSGKLGKILGEDFGSSLILFCNECLPPDNLADFRLLVERR